MSIKDLPSFAIDMRNQPLHIRRSVLDRLHKLLNGFHGTNGAEIFYCSPNSFNIKVLGVTKERFLQFYPEVPIITPKDFLDAFITRTENGPQAGTDGPDLRRGQDSVPSVQSNTREEPELQEGAGVDPVSLLQSEVLNPGVDAHRYGHTIPSTSVVWCNYNHNPYTDNPV